MCCNADGARVRADGQAVANIEVKGMIPRVDTLEMLAKVLEVTVNWLAFSAKTVPTNW